MLRGTPSVTALRVARQRAAHQLYDEPTVFDDPLALAILGREEAEAIRTDPEHYLDPASYGLRSAVVARSRYAEDELLAAIDRGVGQLVILGAGLDTFAYRQEVPVGTTIVEVDHPASQAWKREQLQSALIAVPDTVTFAALDLAEMDLEEGLRATDLDFEQPMFVSWLGVSFYLNEHAVRETLGFVGSLAPGSGVVFDYLEPAENYSQAQRPGLSAFRDDASSAGEPWVSFFEPGDMAEIIDQAGFGKFSDEDSDAIAAHYFAGRTDSLIPRGPMHYAVATR
jgi:methyltransferase (TIGR00027 family)